MRRPDKKIICSSLALVMLMLSCGLVQAQEATRPKIGVALSGGGARGFAHIGVLRWFEEHRIPIDYLAGTSMGGLIGGIYATGQTPDDLVALTKSIDWIDLFRPVPAFSSLDFRRKEDRRAFPNAIELGLKGGLRLPSGLNSGHQVGLLLSGEILPYTNLESFDQLPIPFRCLATDMVEAKQIVLSKGSLPLALQATMAIPGVFAPVVIEEKIYASDGGLLNNVPTDVVKQMGADIIIAVDIGTPLGGKDSLTSLGGVLGQTIGVITIENVRRNLKLADVLVAPKLEKYTTMDFPEGQNIIQHWYDGAAQASDQLLPLALSEAEWQKHINQRRSKIITTVPTPEFIEVKGTESKAIDSINMKLVNFIGRPVDANALNTELTDIWGRGRFLALGYQLTKNADSDGLLIYAREKAYAPPFLNLGFEMNNTRSDVLDVNLRARVTLFDFGSYGSEIRLDASIGSEASIGAEYYRLIRNSRFFVAPFAYTEKVKTGIFVEEEQVAQYDIRQYGIGADIGYGFSSHSELRIGYEFGRISASREIGDPVLDEVSGKVSLAKILWRFDSTDSAVVPTRGFLARTNTRYVFDSPATESTSQDQTFVQTEARISAFFPFGKKNTLFLIGEGDTSFSYDPVGVQKFPIGGLLRVGGLSRDEFRGNHVIIAGAGYLRKIADMPPLLGEKISVGAWWEVGSAFDDPDEADYINSVSVGGFVETILGPIFLGGSLAEGGRTNFFFAIGRFF